MNKILPRLEGLSAKVEVKVYYSEDKTPYCKFNPDLNKHYETSSPFKADEGYICEYITSNFGYAENYPSDLE